MKRERIENHEPYLPNLHIQYVFNRAIVSYGRDNGEPRKGHIDVYFGILFFWRLGRAIKKISNKYI